MKNDSISDSSKIKELIRLYKLGVLSDEEYHGLLKSQILSHWEVQPFKQLNTKKELIKDLKEDIYGLSRKFKKSEYDLLKSENNQAEIQPSKEKVEKILWILLN
jgi:hypothetical protein